MRVGISSLSYGRTLPAPGRDAADAIAWSRSGGNPDAARFPGCARLCLHMPGRGNAPSRHVINGYHRQVMSTLIRNTDAVLVIVDISGYTRFVQQRPVSLEHAESIVTELIEAIIDQASNPLVVNKLEGDAALLYAETHGDRRVAIASVVGQLARFFSAFSCSIGRIKAARSHCNCDACANIDSLQLKAFLHVGEIVVKRVRQFEEIAGEAVIMVHRMTKNSVPMHEYVLMSDATRVEGDNALPDVKQHAETIDGIQTVLHWCNVEALMQCPAVKGACDQEPGTPIDITGVHRIAIFKHLPVAEASAGPVSWWGRLWHRFRRV